MIDRVMSQRFVFNIKTILLLAGTISLFGCSIGSSQKNASNNFVLKRAANTVPAAVTFSPTNAGLPLNPAFNGLSYEKLVIAKGFFNSTNTPLINLFSMIGPAVLRIGGGTVDTTGWNGISNTVPITPAEVDTFASLLKRCLQTGP